MKKSIYTLKEVADELGLDFHDFLELMIKEGLLDKNYRPTEFSLKNGLFVEEKTIPDFPDLSLN